jgi:hypothetical protein
MQPWGRRIVVIVVALGGIVLVALGIREFLELLEIGMAPPEILHRKVPATTVSLFLGLVMILWVLIVGIRWTRSRHDAENETGHPPSS